MFKFLLKISKWLVLVFLLPGLLAWFYPEKFLTVDSGPATADVLIVIGGGQHERPVQAAMLFRQHAAPRIIVSGEGDDEINRRILITNGVPPAAIEVENKSTTTRENAVFTDRILRAEKIHSVILVTSWYHARRAQKAFEHFAPEIKFYSRPSYWGFDRGDWKNCGLTRHMRLEFLKLAGYWIRYGVNPF